MAGFWALRTWSSTSAPDFAVPASGEDVYRCFVVPTDLPRTSTFRASTTGRAIAASFTTSCRTLIPAAKVARKMRATPSRATRATPGRMSTVSVTWGAGHPGDCRSSFPTASVRRCRKKADIIVQIHYHPSGKPETDRTQVGLYFARKPVKRTLQRAGAWNPNLVLPTDGPDPSKIEVKASWTIPVDVARIRRVRRTCIFSVAT